MRRHGAFYRPGAIVRRRKRLQKIAREIPRTNRAFRQLGDSARRAAESLRDFRSAIETLGRSTPRDPRVARDLARRGAA